MPGASGCFKWKRMHGSCPHVAAILLVVDVVLLSVPVRTAGWIFLFFAKGHLFYF